MRGDQNKRLTILSEAEAILAGHPFPRQAAESLFPINDPLWAIDDPVRFC